MNTALQPTLPTIEPAPDYKPDPLQMLGQAIDRGISVAELGPLMDLIERDQANKARAAFSNAMADFQAHCPTILKSKRADRYNYAPLDEILRTIRPHLESAGLSVRFTTRMDESSVTAICTVAHRDGHSEQSEFSAPVDKAMKVNATQQVGSANSYAKRYALCNTLNLVGSEFDDDGVAAGKELTPDDDPATDEQLAYIDEFRQADKIPAVTLKWLDKQDPLTVGQAATLLKKLRKADK